MAPLTKAQRKQRATAQRRNRRNWRARSRLNRDSHPAESTNLSPNIDLLKGTLASDINNLENRLPSLSFPIPAPEPNYSPISSSGISYSPVPPEQHHGYSPEHFYCSDFPRSPILLEESGFWIPSPALLSASSVEIIDEIPRSTDYSHSHEEVHVTHFFQFEGELPPQIPLRSDSVRSTIRNWSDS